MEVGVTRVPLSNQEREKRRREGRCFSCNQTGHNMYSCPSARRVLAALGVSAGERDVGQPMGADDTGGEDYEGRQEWIDHPGSEEEGGATERGSVASYWDAETGPTSTGPCHSIQLNY